MCERFKNAFDVAEGLAIYFGCCPCDIYAIRERIILESMLYGKAALAVGLKVFLSIYSPKIHIYFELTLGDEQSCLHEIFSNGEPADSKLLAVIQSIVRNHYSFQN